MTDDEWKRLLEAVDEIQDWFPEGVAFIEGIAVFAHARDDSEVSPFVAKSHDADFVILTPDYVDLRDIEVLTSNRRLSKHQFVKDGFEFYVYVENQNDLVVPADEVLASSVIKSGLRVACCEHLLALKSAALIDRKGTSKGNKDEEDILRILLVTNNINPDLVSRISSEMLQNIKRCVDGDAVVRLTNGNLHTAKKFRDRAREIFNELTKVHYELYSGFKP